MLVLLKATLAYQHHPLQCVPNGLGLGMGCLLDLKVNPMKTGSNELALGATTTEQQQGWLCCV